MIFYNLQNQFKLKEYIVIGYETSSNKKLSCSNCGRHEIRMAYIVQQKNTSNYFCLGKKCAANLTKQHNLIALMHKESISLFQKSDHFYDHRGWEFWSAKTNKLNSDGRNKRRARRKITYDGYSIAIIENKKGKFMVSVNNNFINGLYYDSPKEACFQIFAMYGQAKMEKIIFDYYANEQE